MSSPPMRRCSGGQSAPNAGHAVLPADAGVFRPRPAGAGDRHGPPRRRGGVPVPRGLRNQRETSSPPTRGCSGVLVGRADLRRVLPADAGVFRQPGHRRQRWMCPPRRRGGVPPFLGREPHHARSSPPTRGCSGDRFRITETKDVLPDDAGVFRISTWGTGSGPCPPRRRGGVPALVEMRRWGCRTPR